MPNRTATHALKDGATLHLSDLSATVKVTTTAPGNRMAFIDATGDQEWLDALTITYVDNRLTVAEPPGSGASGGVTITDGDIVIGGGSVQVNTFGRHGSSSITSVGRGNIVIGGHVGGRVIVNGVDVTAAARSGSPAAPVEDRTITIRVPHGTDFGIDGCDSTIVDMVAGRIRADLSGRANLTARGATGTRLHLAGQTRAAIDDSTGPVGCDISGQSSARIAGKFDDIELSVSGQSSVSGRGTYGHVSGHVSGQSSVNLTGQAIGSSVRTSGQSSAHVDCPAPPRGRSTGGWDF